MRTYFEALTYLNRFISYERQQPAKYSPDTLNLDRVHALLDRLGRPDRAFRSIHVAGTKGKGSTSVMIASCLRAAGYRIGLYTSPHLHTFRERMRVNDELISREDFARLVDEIEPHVEAVAGITWFEIVTALAFLHFAQSRIEVAVVEVGLGGRFDATNVLTPLASVITPLSMDHMNLLGNTLEQIAFEKAGIIKRRIPVVSAPQRPEAFDVLRRVARFRATTVTLVGRDVPFEPGATSLAGQEFSI
ncbi:MAG: bifunctional folylpolyglutamate synthase/dihydrofolate synthase, partial [Chloroflexi bacterium]|nr:bifunctional folylpolyglutamate synthase/dihydrofolate synthase [Chloroflexota bacterium]